MILSTERLYLREMEPSDFEALCAMLQDKEVMYAYEHAFSDEEAWDWLNRQISRYQSDGFGLWGMIQKTTGQLIGQCGLTWQDFNGKQVLEVGYLLRKDCCARAMPQRRQSPAKNTHLMYSMLAKFIPLSVIPIPHPRMLPGETV